MNLKNISKAITINNGGFLIDKRALSQGLLINWLFLYSTLSPNAKGTL